MLLLLLVVSVDEIDLYPDIHPLDGAGPAGSVLDTLTAETTSVDRFDHIFFFERLLPTYRHLV
jgi:hypothetical protein